MISYEDRLASNLEWALTEGSIFFEDRGAVQTALRRIAQRLEELGISYAIVGGMALFTHGVRRFTEDVDILIATESLQRIHDELEGRGYVTPFARSKNLRDTEHGVRIEFLLSGQFPGDGKPKPVSFPRPEDVSIEVDGVRVISLPKLVELKLASGMTSPHRVKDLADVQELIRARQLPLEFASQLDPFVRSRYQESWHLVHSGDQRFMIVRPDLHVLGFERPVSNLVAEWRRTDATLDAMLSDGVQVDDDATNRTRTLVLFTTDEQLARKHEIHPEQEFFLEGGSQAS